MFLSIRNPSAAAALDGLLGSLFLPRPSGPLFTAPLPHARLGARPMALSVEEIDGSYVAAVELPGVPKEAIGVEIEANVVTVLVSAQAEADKKEADKVLYSERRVGAYRRSFALPEEVDTDKSSAKYENGVLTLTLTRATAKTARQLTVQ